MLLLHFVVLRLVFLLLLLNLQQILHMQLLFLKFHLQIFSHMFLIEHVLLLLLLFLHLYFGKILLFFPKRLLEYSQICYKHGLLQVVNLQFHVQMEFFCILAFYKYVQLMLLHLIHLSLFLHHFLLFLQFLLLE